MNVVNLYFHSNRALNAIYLVLKLLDQDIFVREKLRVKKKCLVAWRDQRHYTATRNCVKHTFSPPSPLNTPDQIPKNA